ncbi:MAG: Cell division protein ftsA [Parcubacteria group bacterium GW2011_GWA2_43_9b]|uniref:Cell division protein FtsA n=1 Tax=Candidatus Portnoybacteria bacterium RIFCSPLOWO2_02_FULL_39_11 TaxID=1802001 RepID=A0A1G2FWS9_9BACT|nr:MAG: Cell division protein ftsA [Parcubacteria group bacterium GW2011_GWA2_43_9b]OGZ42021.1 MAG: cell division protein FtsA [Candidatus Portnoybacteria bacterium RIFCSPLOWO2_02_FULL_39_11]
MPKEKIIVGLDVGTCNVRVAVAKIREGMPPQILGVGKAAATGMRKGVVVDIEETVKNIREAAQLAGRISGVPVEEPFVGIGGSHISCRQSRGVIAVSRADGEISEEDKVRAISAASAISLAPNREILHVLPRRFTVDGQDAIKDPVGMSGVRLEVDALIIEGATPFIKNLVKCVREADVEEAGLLLSCVADSNAVLTKRQKELGVLLLDLGGGTTSLAVYEEGDILHCQVLPVGSMHITNDLAIGLRTSIDTAEKIKLEYGSASPDSIGKKEMVDLVRLGEAEGQVARLQVAEIIEARVNEILDLVNKELKRIDRAGLLPAGVVLVGGGAKLPGLVELTKEKLKLPARIGYPQGLEGIIDQIDDPEFATCCGLIISALSDDIQPEGRGAFDNLAGNFAPTVGKIKKWIKGFAP